MLKTTEIYSTHQIAKERLIVLRGLSGGKPGKPGRAYSTYILIRSKPDKLLSREELIVLIYLGGVSPISY